MIIDVAVTGVDGQSRSNDEATERPLQTRYDQKMAKYGRIAEQSNLLFVPAVFLTQGKFMVSSKRSLRSGLNKSWLLLKGTRNL